nr:MAG TPA: hypothetical protein [Caudoviricetes sp.]
MRQGCVVVEWRWCDGCDGLVACLLRLPLPLPFLLLVFGVVRAQLCEHARYPRTPSCSSCCFVLSSLLFCSIPRLSLCWNGCGVCLPCVTVSCGHDCDG